MRIPTKFLLSRSCFGGFGIDTGSGEGDIHIILNLAGLNHFKT